MLQPIHKANNQSFFEIILLALLFSTSFLFNKIAIQEIAPITLVALRVGIGGILLLLVLKLKGTVIPTEFKVWKYCFILGFFLNGLPFVLFSYSLTLIPTNLSALLNGMTPIITVLLANVFLKDEKLTLNKILGVILGLLGFLILFMPGLLNTNDLDFNIPGMMLSFCGGCLYAFGAIYARKCAIKTPPLVAPTLQLLTSLIYLIPAALIFDNPYADLLETHMSSWAVVLGIAIMPTALAFIIYHRIISQFGATFVVMSVYLLPIFATILGIIFLNEKITMNFVYAGLCIMLGLGILNGMIPIRFLKLGAATR